MAYQTLVKSSRYVVRLYLRVLSFFFGKSQLLNGLPARYRPALCLEAVFNVGLGPFGALAGLSTVVLKSILDGNEYHLAWLGALVGGSSLLGPFVTFLERYVTTKKLVVIPFLLMAMLLWCAPATQNSATLFVLLMGGLFVLQAAPRVSEMNMFQLVYPTEHRSLAVGWLKAIAGVCSLGITLAGYLWFSLFPQQFWVVFCLVGLLLLLAASFYAFVPVKYASQESRIERKPLGPSIKRSLKILLADKRFMVYQLGFSFAGFANHMGVIFIAEILQEKVLPNSSTTATISSFLLEQGPSFLNISEKNINVLIIGFIVAVIPALLSFSTSPVWGRMMSGTSPVSSRLILSSMQCIAFVCVGIGGATLELIWFLIGITIYSVSLGGGVINWLTGSLYFAPPEHVSLYNSTHVTLTGVRGLTGPLLGGYLLSERGGNLGYEIFWVSAGLLLVAVSIISAQYIYEKKHHLGV